MAGGIGRLALFCALTDSGSPAAMGVTIGIGSNARMADISSLFNWTEAGTAFSAVPGDTMLSRCTFFSSKVFPPVSIFFE